MTDKGVPDAETWFRIITRASYINSSTNKLTDQSFKNAVSESGHGRWSHEMSGRRSSLCKDIDAEGIAFVERLHRRAEAAGKKRNKKLEYAGVAHATAKALRGFSYDGTTSDVIHTPKPPGDEMPDEAHTDFVLIKGSGAIMNRLLTFLQDRLHISFPNQPHPFMQVTPSQTASVISQADVKT